MDVSMEDSIRSVGRVNLVQLHTFLSNMALRDISD